MGKLLDDIFKAIVQLVLICAVIAAIIGGSLTYLAIKLFS